MDEKKAAYVDHGSGDDRLPRLPLGGEQAAGHDMAFGQGRGGGGVGLPGTGGGLSPVCRQADGGPGTWRTGSAGWEGDLVKLEGPVFDEPIYGVWCDDPWDRQYNWMVRYDECEDSPYTAGQMSNCCLPETMQK